MGILNQGQVNQGQVNQGQFKQVPTNQNQVDQEANGNQEAFDKFVINGLKILHSSEVTDNIINRVVNAPDKVDAIGEISLDIINRLEQSAGQNNFQVTANTVLNGANVIVGEVINIAEAAGAETLNDEQKYQAFSWTISNYINNAVKTGRISKEQLVQLGQKMASSPGGKAITEKVLSDEKAQGGM